MAKDFSNEELLDRWINGGPRQSDAAYSELSSRIVDKAFDWADVAAQMPQLAAPQLLSNIAYLRVKSARFHQRTDELLGYCRAQCPETRWAIQAINYQAAPFLPGLLPELEALLVRDNTEVVLTALCAIQDYIQWSIKEYPGDKMSLNLGLWLQALSDERSSAEKRFRPNNVGKAAEWVLRDVCSLPHIDRPALMAAVEKARENKLAVKAEGRLLAVLASCAVANQDAAMLRELWSVASPSLRRSSLKGAASRGVDQLIAHSLDLYGIDLRALMRDENLNVRLCAAETVLLGFAQFKSAESKTMKSYRTALFSGNIKKALPALQAIPSQTLSEVDDCRNVALLSVAYLSYPDPAVQLAAAEVLSEATVMQAALPQVACAKGFIEPLLENLETGPLESALRQTVRSIEAEKG